MPWGLAPPTLGRGRGQGRGWGQGPAPVGPATVGPAPVGPARVGPAPVGLAVRSWMDTATKVAMDTVHLQVKVVEVATVAVAAAAAGDQARVVTLNCACARRVIRQGHRDPARRWSSTTLRHAPIFQPAGEFSKACSHMSSTHSHDLFRHISPTLQPFNALDDWTTQRGLTAKLGRLG